MESQLAFAALMCSGVAWGLIWIPLKFFAVAGINGQLLGLTAYAAIGVIALPFIWRERVAWQGELRLLLLIGLFFGWANIAFTSALMIGSVLRVMLLFYLLPAWGAIGGVLFLRERLSRKRLLAVALSLGGVFVIMGGVAVFQQPLSLADGLALSAGFCYTAAGIANRKARRIPMTSRTLASFVGCGLLALCTTLLVAPSVPQVAASIWFFLAAFAIVWLIGSTLLTTYGITHVEVSRAAVLQVVELLVAVISAIAINGESLGLKESIGAAMIITATLLEATNGEAHG